MFPIQFMALTPLEWVADGLLLLLVLGAIWFYSFAILAAIDRVRQPESVDPEFHPPVTILKPACQLDAAAYDSLASFCQQNYPCYQVVFAVQEAGDPSIEVIQKLIERFPDVEIQLVVDDRAIGLNPKVNNLANAAIRATHDIWVVADSDIRVGNDYLQRIVQPLSDPAVAVVTCPYRSVTRGWVATLEAIGTATDFHAGVLVARKLEGVSFGLGATIVIRQSVLQAVGGFAAIANYLADDYQLGHLPAKAGYGVVLSDYVVEHVLAASAWYDSLQRQLRWARGTRASRPWSYLGLILTHGTVTSLLLLIATGGSLLGWFALGITWSMRLIMGWIVGAWSLKDASVQQFWWLIPLRDLISTGIWLGGFIGNQIQWREKRFQLAKSGELMPVVGVGRE